MCVSVLDPLEYTPLSISLRPSPILSVCVLKYLILLKKKKKKQYQMGPKSLNLLSLEFWLQFSYICLCY